jgi:hypothetical protein
MQFFNIYTEIWMILIKNKPKIQLLLPLMDILLLIIKKIHFEEYHFRPVTKFILIQFNY